MTTSGINAVRTSLVTAKQWVGTLGDDVDGFADVLRTTPQNSRLRHTQGMEQLSFARESGEKAAAALDSALDGVRLWGMSDADAVPGAIRHVQARLGHVRSTLDGFADPRGTGQVFSPRELRDSVDGIRARIGSIADDLPATREPVRPSRIYDEWEAGYLERVRQRAALAERPDPWRVSTHIR